MHTAGTEGTALIKITNITKRFGTHTALNDISCEIQRGSIFGLVGSNGAGKSTLLRLIAGVYVPDSGSVTIDSHEASVGTLAKSKIAYVSDELFFLAGASINRMAKFYKATHADFDYERLEKLAKLLSLDMKRPIAQFSKGMKRQAATILALACKPEVLLFDETFDGLDPVIRSVVKRVIVEDVLDRGATVIITSHSLRELEDTCDQLALLHEGGLVLSSQVDDLKTSLFKVQIALDREFDRAEIEKVSGCTVLSFTKTGSVANIIMRGSREDGQAALRTLDPVLLDIIPLTLEEIFVHELENLGYDFKELFGGENDEK